MPVLRINATENGLQSHACTASPAQLLAGQVALTGPIVIMIHGFKYAPNDPTHCPHQKIFGPSDEAWPKRLGFLCGQPGEGSCIAFGWYARGPLWQAHRRASKLGKQLAALVRELRNMAPQRPVHLIAHSLGSEIALSALAHLEAHSIERIVLLTGASFTSKANEMLTSPAGRTTELFNMTSRENDLFDVAFEYLVAAPVSFDRAIGQGIEASNAINLQLDCPMTLDALARLGLPVAPPQKRVCHWSAYTRPGVMSLYKRILRDCDTLTLTRLERMLPDAPAPRWSRLVPPVTGRSLPGAQIISRPLGPLALKLKNRIMTATSTQGKNNEHAY